jgi:hypothetical protein
VKWLVLACALAACDQAFGLKQTGVVGGIDARYFDAPADAPYVCPPIGTAPTFAPSLTEGIAQNCTSYSHSASGGADHAMAWCDATAVFDGPSGGPLTKTSLVLDSGTQQVTSMRLAPEGDRAIASIVDQSVLMYYVEEFQVMGDGAWHDVHHVITLPFGETEFYPLVSTPTREPSAHVLVLNVVYPMPPSLYELVDDGDPDPSQPWQQVSAQTVDPSVNISDAMSVTPDGLRLLYVSEAVNGGIYYQDRPSIDQPFSTPMLLPDLPETPGTDPFMTEDCARMYVSGLGGVFYATQ